MRSFFCLLVFTVFCSLTCLAQKPVGDVVLGYEYLNAQTPTGSRNGMQGWHAQLEINMNKHFGIFLDNGNFYAAPENVHSVTGGLLYKIKKLGRLTPNMFAEVGESRDSKGGIIGYAPEYVLGIGAAIKINKHLSLSISPGQYVITTPKGNVRNNYVAEFGLVFPFGHKK